MRPVTLVLVATSFVLTACDRLGGLGDEVELSEPKEISPYRAAAKIETDPAKQLGFVSSPPKPGSGTMPSAGGGASSAPKVQNPLTWKLPSSWKEMPQSRFRVINASFGEEGNKGECYVTFLPGQGGGVPANLNRWRAQMGLPALKAEELMKLERLPFLRGEAFFIDMEGSYSGMGGGEGQEGYRMLALIQGLPGLTGFVKLIGPRELVEKERGNFDAFVQSIQFREKKPQSSSQAN